jgi:hypothetical protein
MLSNNPPAVGQLGLDDWLVVQRQRFAAWSASYPGPWDFGAESIPALIKLLDEQLSVRGDLKNPDYADFVDGAVWYLGEVFCRTLPDAAWCFVDYRAPDDREIADFYVRDHVDLVSPYYMFLGTYEGLGTIVELHKHWQVRAADRD